MFSKIKDKLKILKELEFFVFKSLSKNYIIKITIFINKIIFIKPLGSF